MTWYCKADNNSSVEAKLKLKLKVHISFKSSLILNCNKKSENTIPKRPGKEKHFKNKISNDRTVSYQGCQSLSKLLIVDGQAFSKIKVALN